VEGHHLSSLKLRLLSKRIYCDRHTRVSTSTSHQEPYSAARLDPRDAGLAIIISQLQQAKELT
jgi:hypothetical protein